MEIKSYKRASDIPEKYLLSLVNSEIECWGQKPFDEYKICTNPKCRELYGIEDIFENFENFKIQFDEKKAKNFKCKTCNSKTEFIYEKENFLEILKEYIKGEVSRVLLIENEKVEGFGVLSKTNLSGVINYEFATRPSSYDKDELLKTMSREIFQVDDAGDEKIALLHQIYVSKNCRKGNISFEMLKKLVFLNLEYGNIPIVGETISNSNFYPISRTIGFNDISSDKYGYIVQYLSNYSILVNFLLVNNSFNSKDVFLDILKYKRETKNIKNNKRKYILN